MAEIIIFRPKISKEKAIALASRPPLGLLFIAAPLIENNYKVKIIDEETNCHWVDELNREFDKSTICAGVSAMTGTQIEGGLKFSKLVKDRFDIPIVWGGLHASILPEQTLNNDLVDIVVKGEGEKAFLKIAHILKHGYGRENLLNLPNIWWKDKDTIHPGPDDQFIDLNELPPLPYNLVDCEKYIEIKRGCLPDCKRTFDLHTDRGCPHRCAFCYNTSINKCKWRGFSAPKVIEQLEYLTKRFSLSGINFVADNFFVNRQRVADICTEIIRRNLSIMWHADCRIDYFAKYDDTFIELLKRSGCGVLTFGIESGSQRVLDLIYKDINLDAVFLVNEKLKKWQIGVNYHFMVGFPGETKEDVLDTYKVILKLQDKYPRAHFFWPSMYTPYPGTTLYHKCLEMGFKPPRKLEDWIRFEWDEICLPFISPEYSKWLKESSNIVRQIHTNGLVWWFRFRTKIIIKSKIIGPQLEKRFIPFLKKLVNFLKKF